MSNAMNDKAYFDTRGALCQCLVRGGVDDPDGLRAVQKGMKLVARNKQAFGIDRYNELQMLTDVEKLPRAAGKSWVNKLSVDQMIGICFLLLVFASSGYNLTALAYGAGIGVVIGLWKALHKVAPTTAEILLIIPLFFLYVLVCCMGRGGGGYYYYRRGRRWW